MVKRLEDWDKKLSAYLFETREKPFVWGENDCVLFAAKGFEKMTGKDFYSQYLPYQNQEEAAEIIKEAGSLGNLVSRHIGNPHTHSKSAARGDVVLVQVPEETLGLVDDSGQFIACVSKEGLVRIPLRRAFLIWSY